MLTLIDFFIPAPLAALYTLVLALSINIVSVAIGKRVFKLNDTWAQAMYFFCGLLIISWLINLFAILGLVSLLALRLAPACIVLLASVIFFKQRGYYKASLGKLLRMPDNNNLFEKILRVSILIALGALCLAVLAPPTDADSINYHLAIPTEILKTGSLWYDKNMLHFRLVGFGEMLNLLGLANGCLQLSSMIQFIALIWLLQLFNDKRLWPLILGIPVLMFLLLSQKHQLTGIIATSFCFYTIINQDLTNNKKAGLLCILTICFAAGIKYSFIVSAVLLFLLMIVKAGKNRLRLSGMIIISAFIVLAPLCIYKYLHFGDAFSPLMERFKSDQDPVIVAFADYIHHFRDSKFIFPLNIFLPSSFGFITAVLGMGFFAFILAIVLRGTDIYGLITIALWILITAIFGQATGRFFYEPYIWTLILLIPVYDKKLYSYFSAFLQIQFLVILPLILYGAITLLPGIISNRGREQVMLSSSAGYAESSWLNKVLPGNARICTNLRCRSLLPRPYFPIEYLLFNRNNNARLDSMLTAYHINYLVLSDNAAMKSFREKYAGRAVYGPQLFRNASRNPFNSKSYSLTVYELKPICN